MYYGIVAYGTPSTYVGIASVESIISVVCGHRASACHRRMSLSLSHQAFGLQMGITVLLSLSMFYSSSGHRSLLLLHQAFGLQMLVSPCHHRRQCGLQWYMSSTQGGG